MKKFSYVLTNGAALESRLMNNLSREAARFASRISLTDGVRAAQIKEPYAVLDMGMKSGSRVTVTVEGKDEEAAIAAMQNYFVANM